jgi:CBS domain-containing protein
MHARAACRLERLGFTRVYRYSPGKADWRAAGWPTEGLQANTPRAHHAITIEVPTCAPEDPVSSAAAIAQSFGQTFCLVLDEAKTVLGRLRGDTLASDDARPAEMVMENGPTTTRADDDLHALVERMRRRHVQSIIVADPDGRLLGVLFRETAEKFLGSQER